MAGLDRVSAAIAPTPGDLAQAYRAHDPERAGHQQAEGVRVGPEGITVLCSANPTGDSEETRLIRLSDDGEVRWERHCAPEHGAGRAMAALPDGGFAIAGDVQRSELEYQAQLLHCDAEGQVLASRSFGPRGVTGFEVVTVLDDGSALAGGMADNRGWLLCVDAALRTRWELPLADVDTVRGLAPLADRGFALAASQDMSTTELGMTQLVVFTGDQQPRWRRRLPASGRGEPGALTALNGGSLVIVGHRSASERDAAQCWVLRLDAAGEPLWERLIGPANEERRGRGVAALADGGVAVACDGLRDGNRGLRVARLAADGTVAWERSYGGGARAQDVAHGIACTADGGFVLVGSTTAKGPGRTNAWVLRLDGNGGLLWDRAFGCAT
jgi:hypothetical protein